MDTVRLCIDPHPLSLCHVRLIRCQQASHAPVAAEHGIPWRRGYLFYGPPGSGKTSLVTALAGRLHKSISVVDLSDPNLNDGVRSSLTGLAATSPPLTTETPVVHSYTMWMESIFQCGPIVAELSTKALSR